MPAPYPITIKESGVGRAWKYYATTTAVDLTAVTGKPQRCARRIVFLEAANPSLFKDASGNDEPVSSIPAGYVHDADVSVITCSTKILVIW